MAADERLIIRFDDLGVGDVALVGGKNSSLGELRVGLGGRGVRVPDGFAVTAEAYRRLVAANDLGPVIEQAIAELRADPTGLPRVGAMIRSHFLAATVPDEVRDALAVAYAGLVAEAGAPITVAVRSSATAEDLPEASFAGQHESYLLKALKSFKSGERQNVLMSGMAMPLTEQDMADLAAYFSQQKRSANVADPALVAAGERLYRGGNKDTGVPACLACHGPTGQGNPAAAWPSINGQHASYAAAQLVAYRGKQRSTDGDTQMMRNVSATLTDDEIKAVTSYIQGLR